MAIIQFIIGAFLHIRTRYIIVFEYVARVALTFKRAVRVNAVCVDAAHTKYGTLVNITAFNAVTNITVVAGTQKRFVCVNTTRSFITVVQIEFG